MYIGSGAYRETDRQTDHLKSCQTVSSSPAKLFFLSCVDFLLGRLYLRSCACLLACTREIFKAGELQSARSFHSPPQSMVALGIFPVTFIQTEPGIPGLRFVRRECAGSVSEFARVVVPSPLPLDVGGRCRKMYDLCVCDRSSEGSGFSRVCDGKMPASEIGVQKILYRWCFLVGVATSPRQNSLGLSVLLPRSIMIPLLWEERGRESGRSSGVLLLSAWGEGGRESSPTLPPTTIRQGPTYGDDSISSVCTQVDSWTRESSTRTSYKYLKSC